MSYIRCVRLQSCGCGAAMRLSLLLLLMMMLTMMMWSLEHTDVDGEQLLQLASDGRLQCRRDGRVRLVVGRGAVDQVRGSERRRRRRPSREAGDVGRRVGRRVDDLADILWENRCLDGDACWLLKHLAEASELDLQCHNISELINAFQSLDKGSRTRSGPDYIIGGHCVARWSGGGHRPLIPSTSRRHTFQLSAAAVKLTFTSLLTSKFLWFTVYTLFPTICFNFFLLYYYTITRWSLTFKTFSAMPTHMMNIRSKFRSNPCTRYADIVSDETGAREQRTDGRHTKNTIMPFAAHCLGEFRQCCKLRPVEVSNWRWYTAVIHFDHA